MWRDCKQLMEFAWCAMSNYNEERGDYYDTSKDSKQV